MLDKSIIIKLESPNEFTLGEITKITGHIMAKFMPAIIDCLDLEANPRASRTGNVTDAIQDSIKINPILFHLRQRVSCLLFLSINILIEDELN